jgi:imidazolonepropionase-like amidohydrolase
MVKIGMTPAEALQTATLNPARALGKTADFGSVQPGKIADLVLLESNPLGRIENTQRIAAGNLGWHGIPTAGSGSFARQR